MGPQERAELVTRLRRFADANGADTGTCREAAQAIEDLEASKQRWKEATEAALEAMEEQGKELEQVRAQRDELVRVARLGKRCRRSFLVGEAHDPAYRELAEVFASLSPATAALLEGE